MTFVTDALLVDGSVDRERFAELMCSSAASSRLVVDSFAVSIFEDELVIVNFSIRPTVGGCELGGLRSSSPSQGQVHRGAAEVNLDLTRGT